MADIWFTSDTHFFHDNVLKFTDAQGKPIRSQRFQTVQEMNAALVANWNALIKPQDKVYHLGDVAVGVESPAAFTQLMSILNGHKRLILGNHDHIEQPAYRAFERIELWTGGKFKQYGFVASHIPLRPDQMRDGEYNVHGHIHQNIVGYFKTVARQEPRQVFIPDPHYINVCVEQTDYKPVHLDEIIARIKNHKSDS